MHLLQWHSRGKTILGSFSTVLLKWDIFCFYSLFGTPSPFCLPHKEKKYFLLLLLRVYPNRHGATRKISIDAHDCKPCSLLFSIYIVNHCQVGNFSTVMEFLVFKSIATTVKFVRFLLLLSAVSFFFFFFFFFFFLHSAVQINLPFFSDSHVTGLVDINTS